MINLYNEDCLEAMKKMKDNEFDLAVCDPPYGIGEHGGKARTRGRKKTNGIKKNWDNKRPSKEYFSQLQRVSKNQIIFGGNYFADLLPASRCWIYWQKNMGGDFADGELAWTSFDQVLKQYTKRSETLDRIHPTQKPVQLYLWLLSNFANAGDRILDTHLGSGSIALACHDMGFDLEGYEIDKEYFKAARQRLENHQKQLRLF